jgi:hypothetical protein
LLGINCDDNKDTVLRAVKKEGITLQSWWDGGRAGDRITSRWQVHSYPTIYVLDHKGVIRYKNVRGAELDKAVDQLLAELNKEKKN